MKHDEEVQFCTIVTESHIPYALTLFKSVSEHYSNAKFSLLICGCSQDQICELGNFSENIEIFTESSFDQNQNARQIIKKYQNNPDHLRWSLKASLLLFLVQERCDKAIYFDSDIFVVGGLQVLTRQLEEYKCLLTPHWRPIDPCVDSINFELCFQHGIYNAGFFGISNKGIDILKWWESVCLYKCSTVVRKGYYVDQRYLDIIPTYFNSVKPVQHRGCNIAFWNLKTNTRTIEDGKLKILGKWEPIFIHFSPLTIRYILSDRDPELIQYYDQWADGLDEYFKSTRIERQKSNSGTLSKFLERARKKISRELYNFGDRLNY